ncbi:MAG: MFS transporter [Usitatibacter sp.]
METTRPRQILPVIVFSQFAGTSLWFAGNAILPELREAYSLGDSALATITSAVQLGFIAGTLAFALLNLSDRFSPRKVFFLCAILGALVNGAIGFLPKSEYAYVELLSLRFATGFLLAGIYPVGMKIAAGWYRQGLGGALGYLVGALVLGTAFPHLLKGLGQALPWIVVIESLSVLCIAGGLVMFALVPDGPYLVKGTRFDIRAIRTIFSSPGLRASAFGYFGHMWELYTFWTLMPLMIAGYAAMHSITALNAGLWSFAVIAAGSVGCVVGGMASQRMGSARVAFAQLSASGLYCLLSPLAFLMPFPAFIAYLMIWGAVVVGDSPQFSALTAATAPKEFVGSALTIVNCIGFALTVASIQLATALAGTLPVQWWFVPVAIGPALGLLACWRLIRRQPA